MTLASTGEITVFLTDLTFREIEANIQSSVDDAAVLPLVLAAYFEKQPPFGHGKNKAEFPDALVLETLREWCAKNELNMAVVSLDQGVQAACAEDDDLPGDFRTS